MANNKAQVNDELENVRVVIRIRPLNKKEVQEGHQSIVTINRENKVISLVKPNFAFEKPKSFKFDHIFPEDCAQVDLYQHIAFPIVEKVLQGYNGTVFAYGQTGTGKTYTMAGKQNTAEYKGIIPNTFSDIFNHISKYNGEKSFVVTVTYLEIYNEDVRDLLSSNSNAKLEVRERLDVGVYVKDLMGFTVDSIESITELMNRGNTNRMTKSTLMNDVSSRSHAIFTITIESKNKIDDKTTIAKLNLVDLAGSERLSRTQATGEALREASNINQSLSVLGNVITALVDEKSTHIPYRNSKLTRLLQDSLGGNSKTAMIAMISPSENDYEESLCTLRYASRVKYVKNQVRANIKPKKNIYLLEQEITKLTLSLVTLRKEKEALVLARNKDKELYERFQKTETIETTHYFDDRKSVGDYSSDDDIENYDFKALDAQESSEIDPAIKRFCNFLIRQAPGNTLSSILKISALRELDSYHSKDNLVQSNDYDEISEYQSVLCKLIESKSTQNLTGITRMPIMRRSRSLNSMDSLNLSEDFIEMNSIRVSLEKLQSILTGNVQMTDAGTSFENQNDLNTTLIPIQNRNDDDYESYVKTIQELKDKLDVLYRENADLDRTNTCLQMQLTRDRSNYENLNDCCNAALRRIDDLFNEIEELESKNLKLNDLLKGLNNIETDVKEKDKEAARLTRELSVANENISKLECEANLSRHRECNFQSQIQNKDDIIARLQTLNKQLDAEKESLKTMIKNKVNEANEEEKRNEDKLRLVNVRLKCLEDSLVSTRNQNNNLRETSRDLNKIIEDQRQEILNLKNFNGKNMSRLKYLEDTLVSTKTQNDHLQKTNMDFNKIIEAQRQEIINLRNLEEENMNRLKYLEDTLASTRNQDNNLQKTNMDFNKIIEAQRLEIINLRNLEEENMNRLKYLEDTLASTRNQNNNLQKTNVDVNKIIKAQRQEIKNLRNLEEENMNRLKDLEDTLASTRNQNNNLQKTNMDFNKIIEAQRQEIINLRNFEENNMNRLIRENDELKDENQKMLITLHSEIALKNEIDAKLKRREGDINESLHAKQELKNRISQLEKENLELIVGDSKDTSASLKKIEQAMDMSMEAKDKQIRFLKIEVSKTQAKLSKTIKDLEYATSNCGCKKSARESLSDRRRFEKNVLQDSKRNITDEDNTENDKTKHFDPLGVQIGRIQIKSENILKNGNKGQESNSNYSEILQKYEQLQTVAKRQQAKIEELEKQVESKENITKYTELCHKYETVKCIARRRHARVTELENQLKVIPARMT